MKDVVASSFARGVPGVDEREEGDDEDDKLACCCCCCCNFADNEEASATIDLACAASASRSRKAEATESVLAFVLFSTAFIMPPADLHLGSAHDV